MNHNTFRKKLADAIDKTVDEHQCLNSEVIADSVISVVDDYNKKVIELLKKLEWDL